jgi:hypothetical protein
MLVRDADDMGAFAGEHLAWSGNRHVMLSGEVERRHLERAFRLSLAACERKRHPTKVGLAVAMPRQ